jgi:coatomer subunit beta
MMLYWETVDKYDAAGALLPEMILVCNALRNDLNHPNEFIRACSLRFMCKLNEPELLEPLVASIKVHLKDPIPYVKRTAVLAVHTIFRQLPDLIPDAPELIEEFLQTETDMTARRNGFLMLYHSDYERAVAFLADKMDDIARFGDGFQLVVLELARKACRGDPASKSFFIRAVYQLLDSESAAVAYEAAWTLVSLSSAPTAVRAAASAYAKLLVTQSDNNVKLIVLERLTKMKGAHIKVLQEIVMEILRALSEWCRGAGVQGCRGTGMQGDSGGRGGGQRRRSEHVYGGWGWMGV